MSEELLNFPYRDYLKSLIFTRKRADLTVLMDDNPTIFRNFALG